MQIHCFISVCRGVPALVDFAAMRDTVKLLGGNPEKINPVSPADLVIDHSVQVDVFRRCDRERFIITKYSDTHLESSFRALN